MAHKKHSSTIFSVLILLSMLLPRHSQAEMIAWIFMDYTINKSKPGTYESTTYFSWHELYIDDDEADLPVADFLIKKGVTVNPSYDLGLQYYYTNEYGTQYADSSSFSRVQPGESIKDYLSRIKAGYSWTNVTYANIRFGGQQTPAQKAGTCVYLGALTQSTTAYLNVPEQYRYSFATNSNQSQCAFSGPANQWCAMIDNAITLDFGEVSRIDITNKLAKTAKINIHCTSEMNFILRNLLTTSDSIPLSNGLQAKLELDDKPLNQVIQSAQGDNTFILKAHLEGNSQKMGGFSGMGILAVDYP